LIADRGYDSNKVRALLVKREIEPIIPARINNIVATHQDGQRMRRYKRRWIIERTNSWLQKFPGVSDFLCKPVFAIGPGKSIKANKAFIFFFY
jgi:transposase